VAEDFISVCAHLTVVEGPEVVKFSLDNGNMAYKEQFLRFGTGLGKIGSIFLFAATAFCVVVFVVIVVFFF
jgi:hypothetical protein